MLTKPDTIESGEEAIWKAIFEGRRHHLALGYYITKQPSLEELRANITHKDARRNESNFFKSHMTWSTCDSLAKSRMGTAKLGQGLSRLLSQRIDVSFVHFMLQRI